MLGLVKSIAREPAMELSVQTIVDHSCVQQIFPSQKWKLDETGRHARTAFPKENVIYQESQGMFFSP